jgi:drug/metabolite transporter (DMT)-like permease
LSEGRRAGITAAVLVAVIWGLSFVAASIALTTLAPIILATVRFVIASAIYSPVIVWEWRRGYRPNITDLREMTVIGFLSISIYFWLQYTGVMYAGAGISALLVTGLIPVLTGFAGAALLKERFNLRKGVGIGLGLMGVALIALPKITATTVDWLFFLGAGCLLADAFCWSLYGALGRRLMKRVGHPLVVTAYETVLGTLFLLPLSLTGDWGKVGSITSGQWQSVLYLAIVCSSGGYLLWNFALSRLEAVNASVFLYLEPVSAFVGEFILFTKMPLPLTMLGGVAIMFGALLTYLSKE